jgi:hypothetical protein
VRQSEGSRRESAELLCNYNNCNFFKRTISLICNKSNGSLYNLYYNCWSHISYFILLQVRSILRHPRYGPRSELGGNMYTYLKFGLPRVFPPGLNRTTPGPRDGSSGYDSSDDGSPRVQTRAGYLKSRSEQALNLAYYSTNQRRPPTSNGRGPNRSSSEANLLAVTSGGALTPTQRASSQQYLSSAMGNYDLRAPPPMKVNNTRSRRRSSSNIYMAYPHIQLRGVHLEKKRQRMLEHINLEARGGDMLGIMATSGKFFVFIFILKIFCHTLLYTVVNLVQPEMCAKK